METTQNIIILILLCITVWLYLDRRSLKYWRDYYHKNYSETWDKYMNYKEIYHHNIEELEELYVKKEKLEEIISQQKQELLTRKQSKKK